MSDEKLLSIATDAADQTLQFCETVKWVGLSGLRSQMQRSAVSVPSNIAEGIGREGSKKQVYTNKGKIRFYLIAFGSLRECVVQLELLKRQRPGLLSEVSSVMELWNKVRDEILFVIDGRSAQVHMSTEDVAPRQHVGLRSLNFDRAISRAVERALTGFISQVKNTGDTSLLKSFPIRDGGSTCFSLEAFEKFLKKHGRHISRGRLTLTLKTLGWNPRVCRFGDRIMRVWLESSVVGVKNRSRSEFFRISPVEEKILEVAGG